MPRDRTYLWFRAALDGVDRRPGRWRDDGFTTDTGLISRRSRLAPRSPDPASASGALRTTSRHGRQYEPFRPSRATAAPWRTWHDKGFWFGVGDTTPTATATGDPTLALREASETHRCSRSGDAQEKAGRRLVPAGNPVRLPQAPQAGTDTEPVPLAAPSLATVARFRGWARPA